MDGLPLIFKLAGTPSLVVGGGSIAKRKVELLAQANAHVLVVAPAIDDGIRALTNDHTVTLLESAFDASQVKGKRLVVAATNDAAVNRQVFDACQAEGIPVNTVDTPELCTVTFPAIVDRDPVLVAISTSGQAPALAGHLRGLIERVLPAGIGRLARVLGDLRPRIKQRFPELESRRQFVNKLINGPFGESVLSGNVTDATIETEFETQATAPATRGDVALIGAGPGDPDLLTIKAARVLQNADVVLYDNLVNPAIVDLARRDAEKIYVGKKRAYAAVRQGAINDLLVEYAKKGLRVVRLKGGDPFIFGRGGEEIESLAAQGVPFQVIPGVTAASGCASYAGIPLTYRDIARSVRFITGHTSQGLTNLDWPELAKPNQTVVIYMGLKGWPEIAGYLSEHGLAGTPVALVENGTLPNQRCFTATVATLEGVMAKEVVTGATLIIVGEVVRYRIVS